VQREREEACLAELSTALLQGRPVEEELDRIATRVATLFHADRARIELGSSLSSTTGDALHELRADTRHVGVLHLSVGVPVRSRFLVALASLLAVALDRERLVRDALDAEALRRSDAVKTAVLRTVSHDLRTPLTAIRVAAEGLASPTLDLSVDDRASLLETIRSEATRLQRVVADLLDLSRLQAHAIRPYPDIWTLDELLAQALDELGDDRDRVSMALPEETPPVRVDDVQIERVLVNLLHNALKFSPHGTSVRIDVTQSGGEVIVRVADEGPGLAEQELERIFEPFHTSGDGERRGTGLGLAIARGLAEANGGRVWAERPERGARFALALPAVHAPVGLRA
jgi:two-component system sensor histidine kinase KdpD